MPGARIRSRSGDWDDAHLINAALDVHRDDPAFGYRFIADELAARGISAGENRVARLCSQQRIWSALAKKRGLSRKAGPPVHDDLVARQFTADGPDRTWLTDITEHPTGEGKLYLWRVQGHLPEPDRRLLDGLPDDRPPGRLRAAQRHRAARPRRNAGGAFGPRQPIPVRSVRPDLPCKTTGWQGRWAGSAPAATTLRWSRSSPCCKRTSWTVSAGQQESSCAWRSSPGSRGPTTGDAGNADSAASHPSNTRQSTRPHTQPEPPSPRVN